MKLAAGVRGAQRQWRAIDRVMIWGGSLPVPCYYCGRTATTEDHVVSRALLGMLAPDERPDLGVDTVPACQQCNSSLGARFYPTLARRKGAVKEFLRKRYRALLRMPPWPDHELAELADGQLKTYIVASIVAREELERMLAW